VSICGSRKDYYYYYSSQSPEKPEQQYKAASSYAGGEVGGHQHVSLKLNRVKAMWQQSFSFCQNEAALGLQCCCMFSQCLVSQINAHSLVTLAVALITTVYRCNPLFCFGCFMCLQLDCHLALYSYLLNKTASCAFWLMSKLNVLVICIAQHPHSNE
jgi:hypothetical protein